MKSFQPLILVGPSGSGKSTLAALVARELGIEHLDSDAIIIEMEERSISRIFETEGEAYFRSLEARVLESWRQAQFSGPTILATGGGLPAQGENMALLKALGTTIYLQATPPTLAGRLLGQQNSRNPHNNEERPLLAGSQKDLKSLCQRIADLLSRRQAIYEAAHHLVNTEEKSLNQVAGEIKALLTCPSINIS